MLSEVKKISAVDSSVDNSKKQQAKVGCKTDAVSVPMQGSKDKSDKPVAEKPKTAENETKADKLSFKEAAKSFGKGLISPITSMFSSPKNFLIGVGTIAAGAVLIAATGGAAAPVLVAAGVAMGAVQAGKGVYKLATAKNTDDEKEALYDLGGATSTIALSVAGAKSSLKQANVETEGLNLLTATKKCITSSKSLAKESVETITTGSFKTNLKTTAKLMTETGTSRNLAKTLHTEAQETFEQDFLALKEALPEKYQPQLTGRVKSSISLHDKMVREKTVLFDEDLQKVQDNPRLTPEIKKQKIKKLKEERKRLNYDNWYVTTKVQDVRGARLTLEDTSEENIEELVSSLAEAAKKGDIEIREIRNYGNDETNFYFNEEQIQRIKAEARPERIVTQEKLSGYTAVQLKVRPKTGREFELQIRGKKTSDVADWEHLPYDLGWGKDITKGNHKVGILVSEVSKASKKLNKNPELNKLYKKYIKEHYAYARALETGKPAVKPVLPEGIDPSLSAEKLESLGKQISALKAGDLKNPYNVTAELPVAAGIETLEDDD